MTWRFGIRSKVFAVSLALVALVGLATAPLLEAQLRERLTAAIETEVLRHARTSQVLLELAPPLDSMTASDAIADRIGSATTARITVIDAEGQVLGDSALSLDQVRHIANHRTRPEVLRALDRGTGMARRYSASLQTDMLYVAVPFRQRGATAGVVRVAIPLVEVDEALGLLRWLLGLVALTSLVVAVVASGVASQMMTRRVRGLVARVRSVSRSHEPSPQLARDADELGDLAGSFRQMAEELQSTVSKLRDERDRLQTILEEMRDAVLALDEQDRITLVNPEALAMLELAQSPVGRPLAEAIRAPTLAELVSRCRSGTSAAVEFELAGESPRTLLAHAAPLRMSGGVVLVMHDVSEMRRLETIRRDFVANVSHELRTPVSVIRANAETLLAGAIEEPTGRDFVEAIDRNAQRLTLLIADLLDLSRIEAGSHQLQLRPVELAPAFERAVAAVHELGRKQRVALDMALDAELQVLADADGLDQILLNLLDNAVKYSETGGHVELRASAQRETIRIEVEDDGPGIEPHQRERIFERFYRVDGGRSREAGGTGLGLAIVKHLTDAMDGRIGVAPAPERGSVFWLELPAVR